MYNPKDLESDIDHSFFDSDYDDSSLGKDAVKNANCSEIAKLRSLSTEEHKSKQESNVLEPLQDIKESCSKETIPLVSDQKDYMNCSSGPEDISSGLSVTSQEEVVDAGSVHKEFSCLLPRNSYDLLTASSSADDGEDDEDGYHHNEDESEEDEVEPQSRRLLKSKSAQFCVSKKLLRKTQPHCLSPQSSESGADPGSDSSFSSAKNGCTHEPPTLTRPKSSLPSSSRRQGKPRPVSVGPRGRPFTPPQESEDTVTDVTPISTPDVSPIHSLNLTFESGEKKRPEKDPEENTQIDLSSNSQEAIFSVEKRLSSDLVVNCPGGKNRKNYSFSNDSVQRIDRENQRLLRELSHPASRSRASSAVVGSRVRNLPPIRLYHSALNRQRQQQRIETENMAFLKRLESVKPTPGMKRDEQLADYQQQTRYLGASASLPPFQTAPSKMAARRTSSGTGIRPGSVVHRPDARTASVKGDSAVTSTLASSQRKASRAAWT